jgi:formate-dependent nitrite reductase membrane component NrfD
MTTAAKRIDARHAALLIALTVCIVTAATTATGLYSYPETLAELETSFIVIHDISGDLAILITGVYLIGHLSRTWRMKKMKFNRYSGLFILAVWGVAAATGVWGQFVPLVDHTPVWWIHFVTSMASVIVACAHGAWAFRPRRRAA